VNIRFLWELEEEVGSPNFAETLKAIGPAAKDRRRRRVRHRVGLARPAFALGGLRGLQRISFHLETRETDQHLRHDRGGRAQPGRRAGAARLRDLRREDRPREGAGFYDDVEKLTAAQIKDFKARLQRQGFIEDHGFKSIRTKDPLEVMKRIWALPTFECTGSSAATAAPASRRSCRRARSSSARCGSSRR
jgi:hypothetical protein